MAVELKKFQAEYKKIEDAMIASFAEMKLVGDTYGNTKKLLDGARLAIGDRIQAMKLDAQGQVLADFEKDSQVKAALTTAKTSLTNHKGNETRKIAAIDAFKKIHKDLLDLAGRIDAEIASRKKMFEPKSLPDMVKLAKTVRDEVDSDEGLKGQSIGAIVKIKIKDGEYESNYWTEVDREIKKSAAIRANASVTDLLEMFKPRLIKLRSDKVAGLAKEIQQLCTAAGVAKKSGNADLAKKAIDSAVAKCDEMHAIVDKYNTAYQSNKSFLEQNPDAKAIFAVVSKMTATENLALKAVQAAQAGK